FLQSHCIQCHGKKDPEGNLSLEDLGSVDEVNSGIWRSIWAQVSLKEMPPRSVDQPAVVQRLFFSDWIVGELTRVMRDKGGFTAHLDPNKANFVDHDLLFGPLPDGIQLQPASSPARLWRVTPLEHITRLNELINLEPEFDPENPGLRTRGDAVPTNHGGELKLYFGTDNIIHWLGGTVAYATAVKSIPAVFAWARNHGLKNYPHLYSVNSAEATQVLDLADDVIRYMAYGPLSIANPEQITDDPTTYKMVGDIRGLPTSIVYSTKVLHPLTPIHDLMKEEGFEDERLRAAVDFLFEALTFRPPSPPESDSYLAIVKQSIQQLGKKDGAVLGLSSIFLDRDALFRPELATKGKRDQSGRVMLQDWELGLAVNHALRYIKPDETLRQAIVEGRMRTREDVQREVQRMLADPRIRKPRILQFFRDYFDYDRCGYVCKDTKALTDAGANTKGMSHYRAMFNATASTDRLIELILEEDKDVLRQLLTTNKAVVTVADKLYFGERLSSEEVKAAARIRQELKKQDKSETTETDGKEKKAKAEEKNLLVVEANLSGPKTFARVSRRSYGNGSLAPDRILSTVPEGQRLGVLTHP
ncbi:MAG: DUF1592 domain-containing protein, partial [Planctomycetes bacterium]|nr:DUF1592 domain-containing protein [Planctomycetota bacterium]